jgi:hypothetical protein
VTKFIWTNTSGGDFANGANWNQNGAVPGPSDDALLTTVGTYTVTSSANETVNSLQMISTVTFDINGGTFYAAAGSGSGTDAGVIAVANNATFEVGGTLAGAGTVMLNSINNFTGFELNANTTLSGGGKLILSDNGNNVIFANAVADTLTNTNDTISGSGQLGNGGMSFANGAAGVVNATGTNAGLVLNFGTGTASNAGLIEATGPAGLTIRGSTITQTGTGTIKAVGNGVAVNLDNSIIAGGTLSTATGGVIQSVSNGELNGVTITANSVVQAVNNTTLTLDHTITNKGSLELNSINNATGLRINTSTVSLTGAGKLLLSDNGSNYISSTNSTAPYDKLINVNNVISGSGQFGNGALSVDNQAAGIINATGTAAALVINTGGGSFSNEGLIEDTGPAGLQINNGTIILNTGTIAAFGAGSHVDLNNANTTIEGGKVSTSGGGVIQSTNIGTLDGLSHGAITITTGSQILANNNTDLYVDGSIVNQGTITLGSINNFTLLGINSGTVTLTGSGAVTMSDNINNVIEATATGARLVNTNNTISGSGQLGNNSGLAIDNQLGGKINSNGAGGITVNTGGGVFTNEGLVEDTNTGGLTITNGTTIVNSGTIAAFGTGSAVNLYSASLQGGTLTTGNGGVIQSVNYGTLDGATHGAITISANSLVADDNNEYLFLDGSIVNDGTIALQSINNATPLWIQSSTVTLSGSGTLLMSDNINNFIESQTPGTELINVNNTISGSGQIGNGSIAIDNQAAGIINSTGGAGIILNTGTFSFTNEGVIKDTSTGGITLTGATTIVNAGTISASGAGSFINIYSGTIAGGTLSTANGGVIQSINVATLDGSTAAGAVTITTGSQIGDVNDEYLYLDGTISNHGTISLESTNNGTVLWIASPTVTLNGGGTVLLSDNSQNYIEATTAGYTLINANNTIVGSGQIGNGALNLINQASGTIDANGTAAGMTFTTASFTNQGVFEDTGLGGIGLAGITITNDSTIAAIGAGSSISLYSGADIIGGTLLTTGGGVIQSTNVGTLDGATNGALTIAAGSTIADLNNDYLYLDGSIVNDGTIALDSSNNGTILWANSATLTLTGGGAVLMTDNTQNYIDAAASGNKLVNVNNTISGSGVIGNGALVLDNQAGGKIISNGSQGITFTTSSFTNEGIVEATSTGGISLNSIAIQNTGTIEALNGSFINLNGNATIVGGKLITTGGGVIESTNTGTLDGSTALGAVTITAGSQIADLNNEYLYLKGSIANSGTIGVDSGNNGTVLWIDTPTVTLSGAGSVVLTDNANNYIDAAVAGYKLVNVGNTISGAGQIGNGGSLLIDNQKAATINATGNNNLNINLGGATFTNEGLAEGSGAGGLVIQNTTLTNSGTIAALSASSVTITNTTSITNYNAGTLTGGTWEATAATGATSTLSLSVGAITTDSAHLILSGAGAAITASGTALATSLTAITLSGELDVLNGATFTSTNALSDVGTILLSGTLSTHTLVTKPSGVISASGAARLSTSGAFTNAGTLKDTSGTLSVVKGTLNNTGTVAAAGGTINFLAAEKIANLVTGTLTGGTWSATGSGSTLILSAGSVTTDAAIITLSGVGSVFEGGAAKTKLEASLTTVAANGSLNLLNGRGFASTAGSFTDSGVITLGGGALSGTPLTIAAGGLLSGAGSVGQSVANSGTIIATGGTLTLAGETGGALSVAANSALTSTAAIAATSLTIAAGGSFIGSGSAGATTDNGSLTASGGTLLLASNSGAGTATIASGATLTSTAALKLAGVTFATGTGEVLALGTTAGDTATISGFGSGTTIDLLNATVTSFIYNPSTGVLALKNGATSLGTLKFAGTYAKGSFQLASDGHNGTDILYTGVNALPAITDLQTAAAAVSGTPQSAGLGLVAPAASLPPSYPSIAADFSPLGQIYATDTPLLQFSHIQ